MEDFEFVKASLISRFIARFVDRLFAILITAGLGFTLSLLTENIVLVWILALLVGMVYLLTKDALPFLNGQSVGKKLMGIRVIEHSSGNVITNQYGKTFVREIVQWIPLLNIIDAVFTFSDDRKRLADNWADTLVINEYA